MDLESSARELSATLTSSRANERKKSAENLKDLLTRNALPSLLSKNTCKKRGFSWNELFDDINEYILKETEKYETSKSFDNVTSPLCTSLLHMCVAGANKGLAYIKCDKILNACSFILRDGRLTKAIGDAYLNLLIKHVLPCEHYLGFITPSNWEELLDVCISVCLTKNSKLDIYTKLRLIWFIIKNGTKYCQFVIPLRDLLPKLKKYFLQVQNDKRVQEVVVEIVICLLESLSTECRLTMCEFTESILPMILKYYDHSLEQKKKASLFRLLEMTVTLHHPAGKLPSEHGSLAHEWDVWHKHLSSVLEIISLEVTCLQKVRKQNECVCNQFCLLAARAYFLIFNQQTDTSYDTEAGSSSKRQKVNVNKYKTFSDLIYQLQLNHIPWLEIVHTYIKQYAHTISDIDFIALIKIMEILLNGNNQNLNWEVFADMTCLVVTNLCTKTNRCDELNDILLSIWNSSVRNSTATNAAHKPLHSLLQLLITKMTLKYQNVQPLIKLYLEKGMPVNNSSVATFNCLFQKFFNKCSHSEQRINLFNWFINGDNNSVDVANTKEFILRLISNENITALKSCHIEKKDVLFENLFNTIDQSILFSEFEMELSKDETVIDKEIEFTETNSETNNQIQESFVSKLTEYTGGLINDSTSLLYFMHFNRTILCYIDVLLKYKLMTNQQITSLPLYDSLKNSLNTMYVSVLNFLKNSASVPSKINILKFIKELLIHDFEPLLCLELRRFIKEEFFHYANNILMADNENEDDLMCYMDDDHEMNAITLKYNCIYVLAAYCRVKANYREELLELILDVKLYNFSLASDVKCAYKCIEILNYPGMQDPPLDAIFIFMQYLCKDLFRIPEATLGLLNILSKMLDRLWAHDDNMKQNCFIMVRGYLERCEKLFYPPHIAAFIHKCAAEITKLNCGHISEVDETFIRALVKRSKGDVHCLRLYACYLLKSLIGCTGFDTENYLCGLTDIFLINVSERNATVLKDESHNRTLTVLHSYLALGQSKKSLIRKIVTSILELQKEKSLDKVIVKKVLNLITSTIDNKTIETYMNRNVLLMLNFWFLKKFNLDDLPLSLFGFESKNEFVKKHLKWLISTEILCRHGGNVNQSLILRQMKENNNLQESGIIEICFCNIIVLCLPYIVTEKYKLRQTDNQTFKQSLVNANRMFQMTRQILENEKWSNVFVENVGELLLLTASHLCDPDDAKQQFQVDVLQDTESFQYPKSVFKAILTYFGELTDGDIMQYLCENQPIAIFKILLKLWENALQEDVVEIKVLSLHAFKTFIDFIPLVSPSDAFICNYVCNCFGHAIKNSKVPAEIKILAKGLQLVLMKFLPERMQVLRKSLPKLISILVVKKEEGFGEECASLLSYLIEDMGEHLKEGQDVVDLFRSMSSQRSADNLGCSSLVEFSERLKTYEVTLRCPSFETLLNLHQYLKRNREYLHELCAGLKTMRFSEDCSTSAIHLIIFNLNNILKSAYDDKTIIEACNCLSEVGTYDLNTLATVAPPDCRKIAAAHPKQSLANAALLALSEVLLNESPTITNKVANTLNRLFKFEEGVQAIESEDVVKEILKPFIIDQESESSTFKVNEGKFSLRGGTEFLVPSEGETHCQWLVKQTAAILDVLASETNYLSSLKEVCILKPEVCCKIFPPLFGLLLYCSSEKHVEKISEQCDHFFGELWDSSFDARVESSGDSCRKSMTLDQDRKLIIQSMLDVVNLVRLQLYQYKTRSRRLGTLNFLQIEYDKVAWAAAVTDQNLAAIYYGELWAAAANDGIPPASPEETTKLTGGRDLQRILRKCFVSIGELDAIDGCGTAHLTIEEEKRRHLIHTGQHLDALLLHDVALSCSRGVAPSRSHEAGLQRGAVRSLHKSGMHHLALQYIKSLPETDRLNDIKYECLTYLGDWSEFVDTRDLKEKSKDVNCNTQSILKAFQYACLKDCLNIQTDGRFDDRLVQPLNRAKLAVAKLCRKLNMENCQSVYKVLSKLHLFSDIEDYFNVRCDKLSFMELLSKWKVENLPAFQDFKHLEDIIFQRNVILEHSAKEYGSKLKDIVSLQLQYAELSLTNQRIQMSQRLLAVAKKLQTSEDVALLESQISWAKGHRDIALSLLRNIVSNPGGDRGDVRQTAVSLRQYGLWMAESKSDNPRDIINKYLKKSLEVLSGSDDVKTRRKVYYDIAQFADAEYKQVVAYMNSSIFENKVKCLESIKDTASTLKQTQETMMTKDEKKALFTNIKFKELDEAEISSTRAEKECFLQLAMRYYMLSLKECEENNLSVFRVISLWLDSPSVTLAPGDGDGDGDDEFERLLHGIPSRKFVTVLPQLAPRLALDDSPFATNLTKVIRRCAIEHPHHTLPILFSLKNSDKDKLPGAGGGRGAEAEPRVAAAGRLVRELAGQSAALAAIVAQMELLCDATISFANFKPPNKDPKQMIPKGLQIHRLGRLDAIPIPTATVPVRNDCNYTYLQTVVSFDNYFELVGGINCPKKINCKGSDGVKRILLVKGQDDLRQDAVMQQVFNIVNTLLEKNTITKNNKLLIRTYKVVPMSKQSGVLEWCEGTMPLGSYLVGSATAAGAHAKYRPQDISSSAARQKLSKCYELRRSNEVKLATFLAILRVFRPVFQHFFTEHYLDPTTWYERRLAYTRSVATSSMVGYVLGLGDRHVQNILIHKGTAEVVHIDFGIAFDQGKALPTPETIPFRLTQDIVAGFGCSGVEGIFRKSCEKTMQLLRDNRETLLTILEVLLCDPLYSWTVSGKHRPAASDATLCSGSNSGLAERALLGVSSKLSGTEGGAAGGVAVSGQVARLIRAATEPANLCRLFPGWQPYL